MICERNRDARVYLDLSLDGKSSGTVLLKLLNVDVPADGLAEFVTDEYYAKAFRVHTVKFSYSSRIPPQEVDSSNGGRQKHNDSCCSKEPEAYVWPTGDRAGCYSVVFSHMHFFGWCYPVEGYAQDDVTETLGRIYRSTEPEPVEITGCGEIPDGMIESVKADNYVSEFYYREKRCWSADDFEVLVSLPRSDNGKKKEPSKSSRNYFDRSYFNYDIPWILHDPEECEDDVMEPEFVPSKSD